MKLKKLEITGFKSFYDKSSINFNQGVSAVVGPNGCGKSNIVDALRWVMGEQSVKELRGKSMDDVIFAGTDGKPGLNMAEVSLTLSNDNGTGPEELKDFTEIMITRRLHRSGERDYFLNKIPCRLKDIHNIFWGSGMGSRSYSVIQQGNIGAITDAGPEEKRHFIEEAAGVTRYKNRKNEALRKVKATNENLLRINDIIVEIKRQMNGLNRQAKKAERFKKFQEHVKVLDVAIALHKFDTLSTRIKETASILDGLRDADTGYNTKLSKLDSAIEEIKLQRSQKNQQISDQKNSKFETQRHIDKIENDLTHLKSEAKRLLKEIEELKSAKTDIEKKNRNITSEISRAEEKNLGMKEQINSEKNRLEQELRSSKHLQDESSLLNQSLEACKADLMDLVAREARYKNIYQTASNNKEGLKRRLKRIDEEKVLAKKKVDEIETRETRVQSELEEIRQKIEELNGQIRSARENLDRKSSALSEQVKQVQTLELEKNKCRSKYTTLKKLDDNFEWYKTGVRAIMKKNSENESEQTNSSILGIMADFVEPEPGFETAVEAVMGESIQYIIVNDQEAGVESIDYLQTHNAGRSGFIPISVISNNRNNRPGNPAASQPNPPEFLLNHISVKQGYEKIAETFLGSVIVTNDIKESIELWNNQKKTSANGKTIVTKDGDIITPHGIMVGGSKDKLSGILGKKHEIKKLAGKISKIDRDLEKEHTLQNNLESEVRELETNLQKMIERKNSFVQDEMDAEKALYKSSEDLKHGRRHLEIVRLEQETILGEENDIDDELTKYNRIIAENENEIKTAQKKIAGMTGKIDEVSAKLDHFNHQVVDIRLKLTSLNAGFENNTNTLRRLREFYEDEQRRLERLSLEISGKIEKEKTTEERVNGFEINLSTQYENFSSIKETLESNETDFQAIDSRLMENDTMMVSIQNERGKTLEKLRYLELEQTRRQMKLENIAKRIEERYHRTLSRFRSDRTGHPVESETESNNKLRGRKDISEMTIEEMENELEELRGKIIHIGDVNLGAIAEFEQLETRYNFLTEQSEDLVKAMEDLHKVIRKINRITREKFLKTFHLINEKLIEVFPQLFEGGSARLELTDPDNPLETGVEFMIHPPGKKLTRLSLLSGGEKALSAIAFIFSIFLIRPASFCLMDEIDAPLDDANIFRFNNLLKIIGKKSQIVMITHNKNSMEFADVLFGVTMQKKGISQIVSVDLQQPA